MKKIFCVLMLSLVLTATLIPALAFAEDTTAVVPATDEAVTIPAAIPTDPFSWEYLVTIAGAATFTLLVAQFLKFPLDKVWKIPTRIVVYIIALMVMVVATAFTTGLTMQNFLLACSNAFIAALTAMGGYEVTFAKLNK